MKYLLYIFSFVVFVAWCYIFFRDVIHPIYLEKKYKSDIFSKIQWINSKTLKVRDTELLNYIFLMQSKINISHEYKIQATTFNDSMEECNIKEILEAVQKEASESYFNTSLKLNDAVYRLNDEEYFYAFLVEFLNSNLLSSRLKFHEKMYKQHSEHMVTSFGLSYLKLYYLTTLYCENNVKLNRYVHCMSINIKRYIENKSVNTITYRP